MVLFEKHLHLTYCSRASYFNQSINQSNLVFVKRRLNKVLRGTSYEQACTKSQVLRLDLNCSRLTLLFLRWGGTSTYQPKCTAHNTCTTAVWEDQGSNPIVVSSRFIVKTTTIYSLGHGLCTLTAVPRSTQPSTLRGTVKWVSAFGLSNNNKWRWWVWLLAAYKRTHSPGRLAWSEGRRPLGAVPHSSYEPGELSQ